MITKHKVHYSEPWTILKFEKRGIGMLYNNKTKHYSFHHLKPKVKAKATTVKPQRLIKMTPLMYIALIMSGALGLSIALNIINLLR
jgi:hypothetical protein